VRFFTTMKYTQLGRTSLTVSKLCYGTWQFGGDWGSFEAREAQAAIRHALGARSASQIDGWIGAATLDLTSAHLAEIDAPIARGCGTRTQSPRVACCMTQGGKDS
jgi:aryl-alcohol dehydrogenase-like predicted oxidoreductase